MSFCDAARRIPSKFRVTMSGATNGTCSSCTSLNGDYLPEQSGSGCTDFVVAIGGSPCGFSEAAVVLADSNGEFTVTFELRKSGGTKAVYSASGIIDLLAGTITLALESGPGDCNWPATVTVVAVPPDISALATSEYIYEINSDFQANWFPKPEMFQEMRSCCCCCDSIDFVQIAWAKERRVRKTLWDFNHSFNWIVDSDSPRDIFYGSYIDISPCDWNLIGRGIIPRMSDVPGVKWHENVGNAVHSVLGDRGRLEELEMRFETCAACRSGVEGLYQSFHTPYTKVVSYNNQLVVYGCIKWAFKFTREKSGKYKVTRCIESNCKSFVYDIRAAVLGNNQAARDNFVYTGPSVSSAGSPPSAEFIQLIGASQVATGV